MQIRAQQNRQEQKDVAAGDEDDQGGSGSDYDPQEEIWRDIESQINLPELKVETGEEEDELLSTFRVKLYRWRGEWKERGTGIAKFLKNKPGTIIRLLVRADKTLKVIANHTIWREGPLGKLNPLKTANNAWMWSAYDFSDAEPRCEKFAVRLPQVDYDRFYREFEKAIDINHKLPPTASTEDRERYLEDQEKDRQTQRQKKKNQAEQKKQQPKAEQAKKN